VVPFASPTALGTPKVASFESSVDSKKIFSSGRRLSSPT
jgi:hypothetical protein